MKENSVIRMWYSPGIANIQKNTNYKSNIE